MVEPQAESVRRKLAEAGLTHELFDPEAIAEDLAARTEVNESLAGLVESADLAPDPTGFDPGWDR